MLYIKINTHRAQKSSANQGWLHSTSCEWYMVPEQGAQGTQGTQGTQGSQPRGVGEEVTPILRKNDRNMGKRMEQMMDYNDYNDYIWLYMIIYDYIWLYMIIYDYIWLYMIIYDYIWLYMIIYDYIWLYMIIYDYIWLYMIIYIYNGVSAIQFNSSKLIDPWTHLVYYCITKCLSHSRCSSSNVFT